MRDGDWKLISHGIDGSREYELFNIGEDPYEEHELAKEYPDKVKDLAHMIEENRREDGSSARPDVDSPMVS